MTAVRVASCVVNGSYEQMPEVYGAVISWVKENGYEPCGAMFNIYGSSRFYVELHFAFRPTINKVKR